MCSSDLVSQIPNVQEMTDRVHSWLSMAAKAAQLEENKLAEMFFVVNA